MKLELSMGEPSRFGEEINRLGALGQKDDLENFWGI